MIPFGGPALCSACRTLMHPPREDCPQPYECLTGPDCPACVHDHEWMLDGEARAVSDQQRTRRQIPSL